MIVLYGFGSGFGLPDLSVFVMKTEIQLRMAGLPYRKDATGFPVAPKGKVPYIIDDGEIVADSTFIRAHIERKYGTDLDVGLNVRQRAEAWAIERLLEDHLNWAIAYMRWMPDEAFAKGPARFFDLAPEMARARLREEARTRVKQAQWGHGMGRHSLAEVTELGGRSLNALSALLGDKPYLMGDAPVGADATAAAMLAITLTPAFDTPLRREAQSFANLVHYTDRMMQRYFAQDPSGAAAVDGQHPASEERMPKKDSVLT